MKRSAISKSNEQIVYKEYQTIPGVKESFNVIAMNLQSVLYASPGNDLSLSYPNCYVINVVEPGSVYAKDIRPISSSRTDKIKKTSRKRGTALTQLPFLIQKKIKDVVMAIDTRKHKLLFLKKVNNKPSCTIIDLKDLHGCTIKKEYSGINAGALKHNDLNTFLKGIFIDLHFANNKSSLPFFEQHTDAVKDINKLEKEASMWRSVISRTLSKRLSKSA